LPAAMRRRPVFTFLLLLVAGVVGQASADDECDESSANSMKLWMKGLGDSCQQQAIDDFNSFVTATMVVIFLVALVVGLCTLSCVVFPLLKKKPLLGQGCNFCTALIAIAVGVLAIAVPLLLHSIAWTVFFENLCDCSAFYCFNELGRNCWEMNADVTEQDHTALLALPIVFGVLTVLLSFGLCGITIIQSSRKQQTSVVAANTGGTVIVEGVPTNQVANP